MDIGEVVKLAFSISVTVYAIITFLQIQQLKEQNKLLAEIILITLESSNVIKKELEKSLLKNMNKREDGTKDE